MLLGAAFGRVRCGTCAIEGASVQNTLRQTLNGMARDLDRNVIERFMARENNMQPTGRSTAAHEYTAHEHSRGPAPREVMRQPFRRQ